jgi:multiple sugar transport system substrate-binding protein
MIVRSFVATVPPAMPIQMSGWTTTRLLEERKAYMQSKVFSRRKFVQAMGLVALGGGLAVVTGGCAPSEPQVQVVKETQIVEKLVKETQVVEKVVKETQVVEKVVTATPPVTTLQEVTLTFAQNGPEGFEHKTYGPLFRELQKRLKDMYPMLDFKPVASDQQKEAMAMAAGNAPDVARVNVPGAWPMIYRGQYVNLQPSIDVDPGWQENLTHYPKAALDTYTYQGNLYVIAYSGETSGTIYNEDMLKAAGIKLPHEYSETEWDWNAYIETGVAATKGEGADKVWGCWISPDPQSGLGDMVYSNGGSWFSEDGLESRVTEPAFVEAADSAIGIVTKHKAAPSNAVLANAQQSAYQMFINGKLAMMISGDWAFGHVRNNLLPDNQFKLNWYTAPVSPNTKKAAAMAHNLGYYAWKGGKHIPEALAFLKFCSSFEAHEAYAINWTKVPSTPCRTDAQEEVWKLGIIPNLSAMKRCFEVALPYPHTPLINASVAIGYVNTAVGLAMDGSDTRPTADILADADKKIKADLQKGATG